MNKTNQPNENEIKAAVEMLNGLLGVEARKPGSGAKLPAAIRVIEKLEPAGGMSVPVFPASYAGATDQSPPVYDLSGIEYGEVEEDIRVKNGTAKQRQVIRAHLCVLDSPQSQANRMEPAFLEDEELASLVPQAEATVPRREGVSGKENLLRLPHRVADFRVRLSNQAALVKEAIAKLVQGDALALLRLMPTSVLFGFWDSRGEQAKHARILLARIDAFDVVPCRRHSLYNGPYSKDEFAEVVLGDATRAKEKKDADKMAEQGFSNAPSDGLGGVIVHDRIERLSLLSLTDLARVVCHDTDGKRDDVLTNAARRYLFALAGLAEGYARSTGSHRLRSGCELVPVDSNSMSADLRGGLADYADADAVKKLYGNRALLIAIATEAVAALGIPQSLDAFEVTKEELRKEFSESTPPPAAGAAPERQPKTRKGK